MPEQIGKFEVKEKIGEGGMGVVYKAYDPLMHRHVAIKTFTAEIDAEPEALRGFLREAIAVGRLTHRNIVTVHDVFEDAGRAYMVMEYLEGQSLERAMRSGRLDKLEDKLWVMEEVCTGLTFAHSMGVIHRDIKPANVFITARGEVKILDFGIARIASTTVSKSVAKVMGTPYYMSPEQWLGAHIDHRTDIFAFGVMLYELLAGRRPFESHNSQAVAFQVINAEPTPIQELVATIPDELADIVEKALAKDPEERFADVEELREELETVTATLDIPTLGNVGAGLAATPSSGNKTPRSRGKQSSPTERATRRRTTRSKRQTVVVDPGKRLLWAALAITTALAVTAGWFLLSSGDSPRVAEETTETVPTIPPPEEEPLVEETLVLAPPEPVTPRPTTTTAAITTSARVAPNTGTLVVRGTTGASIEVDGQPMGTVPATLSLGEGTHRVRLSASGSSWEDVVRITPGGSVTLDRALNRVGMLSVNSEIWAMVQLDGGEPRETPHLFQNVPAGKHTLRVSRDGYEPQVIEVQIAERENKQLALQMRKTP